MDSYVIGAFFMEACFWLALDTHAYLEMVPVRALIYGLALLIFYPVAARFARERKTQQAPIRTGEAVPAPVDALAVKLPENITVYYRPAPLPRRVAALTIDLVFVAGLSGVWWFTMAIAYDMLRMRALATLGMELGLLVVPLCYFLYHESCSDGQTPGKRQAGIRAIHQSGRALSFTEVFARNILRPLMLLPPFNCIEAFCIRTNGWRQRLGDLAASSVVIIDPR